MHAPPMGSEPRLPVSLAQFDPQSGSRLALVIGNGRYPDATDPLMQPGAQLSCLRQRREALFLAVVRSLSREI